MDSDKSSTLRPGNWTVFAINPDGTITIAEEIRKEGAAQFQSARQLQKLAEGWPVSQLVQVWNQLPGVKPVRKFTDHKTAGNRIWKAIEQLHGATVESTASAAKRRVGNSLTLPKTETKTDKILRLLKQAAGCSLKMLIERDRLGGAHGARLSEPPHSKKLGLRMRSFRQDGERVYVVRGKRA